MPRISFEATFISRQAIDLDLTEQEWEELQNGKKKYYDFLNSSDFDSGEWTEGFVYNTETGDTI